MGWIRRGKRWWLLSKDNSCNQSHSHSQQKEISNVGQSNYKEEPLRSDRWIENHYVDAIKMIDNRLVKTLTDATMMTGIAAGKDWIAEKVVKESETSDPGSHVMNFVKFTESC